MSFQHLTTATNRQFDEMSGVFKYELNHFLSSLFDTSGLPREASKPVIAEVI